MSRGPRGTCGARGGASGKRRGRLSRRPWSVVAAACLALAPHAAQGGDVDALRRNLDALFASTPVCRRATVVLKVADVATGETLYDRDGDKLLTPASNLKIYTTAACLDEFPPTHAFVTRVEATGPVLDGALHGDVVVHGGGDAMLASERLLALVDQVVDAWGLRRVYGEVRIDQSRYASPLKGPGWMWDDEPDYYNMSVTPLMVDFNVMRVRVLAYDHPSRARPALVPPTQWPLIIQVRTDRSAPAADRRPFEEAVRVELGPRLSEDWESRLTMHDPAPWIAGMVVARLRERGVEFRPQSAEAARASEPPPAALTSSGPPLSETLRHFNHVSENAVGEVLLHEFAVRAGVARPTWSDGARVLSERLVRAGGLDAESFRLVDGSGLSRYNLISADSAVRVLLWMERHRQRATFYDALPQYDVDAPGDSGKSGDAAASAAGAVRVAAKPGGMASVSTISGYLDAQSGRRLAFSLLVNGFSGSNRPILALRQQVWQLLAQLD